MEERGLGNEQFLNGLLAVMEVEKAEKIRNEKS